MSRSTPGSARGRCPNGEDATIANGREDHVDVANLSEVEVAVVGMVDGATPLAQSAKRRGDPCGSRKQLKIAGEQLTVASAHHVLQGGGEGLRLQRRGGFRIRGGGTFH